MNAAITFSTGRFAECAMKPRMEKTTSPERTDVMELDTAMSTASRWQFRSNLGQKVMEGRDGELAPVVGGHGDETSTGRAQGENHLGMEARYGEG